MLSEISGLKWLVVPLVAFAGWATHQYVNDVVAQEVAPVKASVEQMVVLQRETVNDQKFDSCMKYKFQDYTVEQRMERCNDEKAARAAYWAWEDCMMTVKKSGGDPAACGRQPDWID